METGYLCLKGAKIKSAASGYQGRSQGGGQKAPNRNDSSHC